MQKEAKMLPGFIPLVLLNKFERELHKQQRQAREMITIMTALTKGHNIAELNMSEDAVVAQANVLESMDKQIAYWLTLPLTKEQTHAIHRCQTMGRELHAIQANIESLLEKAKILH